VSAKSDVVVKGDLEKALPLITQDTSTVDTRSLSKHDLIREVIHVGGFLVPVVSAYLSLSHLFIAFLISMVTLVYIMSELARMQGFNVPVTSTITWNAAMAPEVYEFVTSPIFFAAGIVFALVVFPIHVGYAAIAVFTLGDGFATLFGKKLGRRVFPYNKGKMVEGTLFGFLLAFFGAWLFVGPLKALVGAAVGMLVETLPTPVNDNLTIPTVSGLVMMGIP